MTTPSDDATRTPVTLYLHEGVKAELEYLVKLHQEFGAPNKFESVEDLLQYVAMAIADGSRRPGAWERSMLDAMGIVPDTPVAQVYRAQYGEPKSK